MKKAKRLVAIFSAFVFMLSAFAVSAFAVTVRVGPGWLVDNGGHMDWTGGTRYQADFDFAVRVWNNHRFVIRRVTFWTSADVQVFDWFDDHPRSYTAFVDLTRRLIGNGGINTGRMGFNTFQMDRLSPSPLQRRRMVALHELGHTLGLADNLGIQNVMNPADTTVNVLSPSDRASADAAWQRFR